MTVWKPNDELAEPGTSVRWLITATTKHQAPTGSLQVGEATKITFPCPPGSDPFERAQQLDVKWGYSDVEVIRQTITNEVVTPISAKE